MCWSPLSRQQYQQDAVMLPSIPCREASPEQAMLPADDNDRNDPYDDTTTDCNTRCLFCPHLSLSLDQNLTHMRLRHNFHIPESGRLTTDIETLLSYLFTIIEDFQACIYCGVEKRSAEAIRTHMLDKGHCMMDLSTESEFLEFWESLPGDFESPRRRLPGGDELMLVTGRTIQSKAAHRASNRRGEAATSASHALALVSDGTVKQSKTPRSGTVNSSSPSTTLARRDAMGIVGLSQQQQRALALGHMKTVSDESRARNQARWAVETMGNKVKQKHFKVTMSRSGLFIDPTMMR